VREELLARRSQRPESVPAAEEHEPKSFAAEPHGDVAAIEETQLEQTARAVASDGERTGVKTPYDPAPDTEVHHHAHAHAYPHVMHAQWPRREKHERRVVTRGGVGRGRRANVDDALLSGGDPDPLRAHTEPRGDAAGRPHLRLAAKRTGEAGPRGVHEQGAAPRVPNHDGPDRSSMQCQAQRARTERNAPAGRSNRDGCRGRTEDERKERASHLPITVNVSVAV
jgi:hypothetical protein